MPVWLACMELRFVVAVYSVSRAHRPALEETHTGPLAPGAADMIARRYQSRLIRSQRVQTIREHRAVTRRPRRRGCSHDEQASRVFERGRRQSSAFPPRDYARVRSHGSAAPRKSDSPFNETWHRCPVCAAQGVRYSRWSGSKMCSLSHCAPLGSRASAI